MHGPVQSHYHHDHNHVREYLISNGMHLPSARGYQISRGKFGAIWIIAFPDENSFDSSDRFPKLNLTGFNRGW